METKETDKRICKNCGREIYSVGAAPVWLHKANNSELCNKNLAEPKSLRCRYAFRIFDSNSQREWEVRCVLDKDHDGNHKGFWGGYDLEW